MFKKKEVKTDEQFHKDFEVKEKKKVNSGSTFEYSIEVYDVWDTTSKRITPFGANRIVEGNSSFLYNEQKGFKEPFPENTAEFQEYDKDQIDEKIIELENKIKTINKSNSNQGTKDYKKQLRIFRGYKRSIELRGNGSFMILNSDGVPTFMFDRIGNVKLPIYKNVDRSTLYIPSELKTKNVTKIMKDNDEKNGNEQMVKISTYVVLVLLLLSLVFMFYMGYKMQKLPLDVAQVLSVVAENMESIGKSLNTLESELIINESVKDIVTPNQNIIK